MILSRKLCISAFTLLLSIILIIKESVTAAPKYTPPPIGKQEEDSVSSGSRGCSETGVSTSFYLLVPKDHVGRTTKSHPTFLWYLSSRVDVPMRFVLIEKEVHPPIFETRLHSLQPGIIQLKISLDRPGLR